MRASAGLALIATVLTIAGLHLAREILIPLALAVLLSFLLSPLVKRLQRWKLGRIPSVVFVLLCAFVVFGVVGWAVYLQLGELISDLPQHRGKIRARIVAIRERFERSNQDVEQVIETVTKAMEPQKKKPIGTEASGFTAPADPTEDAGSSLGAGTPNQPVFVAMVDTMPNLLLRLQQAMGPLLNPLSMASIVGILVIFLLLQGEDLRDRIIRIAGEGRLSGTTEALNDAVQRVSRYLLVQALLNGLYGSIIGVGLLILGVPSWALWGFLCGALRFLPYVGPWLGALAPLVISFATAEGAHWWLQPLEVAGLFIIVELIVNLVLEPWLYGASTGVTPFGILAAAVFWTWIWGPIGLLLATPLTVCCVVLGKHFPQLRYLHILLGEDEVLSPSDKYYQRILANDPTGARALATALTRQKPLEEALDALVEVLVHSERDWVNGHLREEKREAVHESLLEIVEALDEEGATGDDPRVDAATPVSPEPRLVILPAHGEAEAVAAAMVCGLGKKQGYACECFHEDLLTAETIARAESSGAEAAFILLLRSTRVRRARVLSKRLRARLPGLKIVVVAYGQGERLRRLKPRLLPFVDGVVATAGEAFKELEQLGFHPEAREKETPAEHASR